MLKTLGCSTVIDGRQYDVSFEYEKDCGEEYIEITEIIYYYKDRRRALPIEKLYQSFLNEIEANISEDMANSYGEY